MTLNDHISSLDFSGNIGGWIKVLGGWSWFGLGVFRFFTSAFQRIEEVHIDHKVSILIQKQRNSIDQIPCYWCYHLPRALSFVWGLLLGSRKSMSLVARGRVWWFSLLIDRLSYISLSLLCMPFLTTCLVFNNMCIHVDRRLYFLPCKRSRLV